MSKDRKERLKELLDKQEQKRVEEKEKREYEFVLEEVNELFPNHNDYKEEVEILSKEDSEKIKDELFKVFPFCNNGIEWDLMFYKTIFSNFIDYKSALAELINKNHKLNNEICYIIDFKYQYVIKTKLTNIIHRVEEVRTWDRYIYCPQTKLVIEFPSNDVAVGWKG
ncbi:hypothetical protein [Lysinibacillus sphaericus]|uniref:Uncharacterized protein n=1 Tax=Lysinibacillus sphaericus OT4b.31 TaxID=1285586 RepID=R7Z9Q0_LYSSH|nr:hypothetical protein [Lysinibacillus sphaericus]EON70671.1 hypothetical protein H131_20607 [Lysinibacillus sphaericus OT4b.31]